MTGPSHVCHPEGMNDTTLPPQSSGQPPLGQPTSGQPQPGQPYAPAQPAPMLESEARTWAMLIHVIAAAALVLSGGFLGFVVPLVLWLIYRERSALVDFHGKQNLNLQLTLLVVSAAAVIIGLVTFMFGFIVTLPLWFAYGVYALVISIVAGVKAYRGEYYRIGLVISFLK